MNDKPPQPGNSSAILGERSYLQERREPSFGDHSYLALVDLKNLVQATAPKMPGALLDYGCGGAPYRDLFVNCSAYVRADMLPGPGIDLVLNEDGLTNQIDGRYDAIFSAQVLEHVADPARYLTECARILKKDGLMLLSTHGLFLEHKCPNDYYRWTSQGLEELLRTHGFEIIESVKLTTGVRGGIQMLHYLVEQFRYQPASLTGFLLRVIRKVYNWICLPALNFLGTCIFGKGGIVPSNDPTAIYIGVCVFARKL